MFGHLAVCCMNFVHRGKLTYLIGTVESIRIYRVSIRKCTRGKCPYPLRTPYTLYHNALSYSPPFLAPNQKVLASKVAMGKMNPIPSVYSNELQRAIFALLSPDPDVRPSITKVFTESHTLSTLLKEKELLEFEAKLVKWQHQLLQKEKELEKKEKQLTSKYRSLKTSLAINLNPFSSSDRN